MFESKELQQRYLNDHQFRQRVDKSELDYQVYLGKAKQKRAQIQEWVQQSILEKFTQESTHSIYFFYGFLQPSPGQHTLELTLFFLQHFKPERKEKFIFVYFNNETPSSDSYFEFKYILTLLPLRLVENLQDFILVKPYFYIKAHDYVGLGSINKIFSKRYRTLQTCSELCSHLKITVHDFVSFVPEEISSQFPKNIKRRPSLINYRFNLQGQNLTESQRNEKNEFELTINSLIKKQVYKLQNYELGEFGIPIIIQLLIHYFRSKPEGLRQEGIFRKSVSIDEENQTLGELSKRNYEYLQQIKNPHLIACLIKRFFTNLKQPIIPYSTYESLLHDQGVANKKQHVKKLIQGLPKLNFMTIAFLLEFLIKDVLPNEKQSKMSANNLAICFSPSLMRSEKASMADIINASKSVNITNAMLSNFQEIFGNQQERNQMYKKSAIDKKKDFSNALKKQLAILEQEKSINRQTQEQYENRHSSIIIGESNAYTPTFGSGQHSNSSFSAMAESKHQQYFYQSHQKHQLPVSSKPLEKKEDLTVNYKASIDNRTKSGQKTEKGIQLPQLQQSKSVGKAQGLGGNSQSFGKEGMNKSEAVRKSRINFNYHGGNTQL